MSIHRRPMLVGLGVGWLLSIAVPSALAQSAGGSPVEANPRPSQPPEPSEEFRGAHHIDVELPLLALSLNAIAVQAERGVCDHVSVMVAVGLRDGADGDFQSTTVALGSEVRFWLRGSHRRWFAAPRVELGLTHVSASNPSRTLGNALIATAGIVAGYRFLLWNHVSIVPEIGFAGRVDVVSRVPDRATLTPVIGIALGWRLQ